MSGNFKHEDLRVIKTQRALLEAFPRLLYRGTFCKLTVNDICEEAQISRVAFYSHFQDKYDLLVRWMDSLKPSIIDVGGTYEEMERTVNGFIDQNHRLITNLLNNANNETLDIVKKYTFSLFDIPLELENGKPSKRYVFLSNFFGGGFLILLIWQKENNYPKESKFMNRHLYDMIKVLLDEKKKML